MQQVISDIRTHKFASNIAVGGPGGDVFCFLGRTEHNVRNITFFRTDGVIRCLTCFKYDGTSISVRQRVCDSNPATFSFHSDEQFTYTPTPWTAAGSRESKWLLTGRNARRTRAITHPERKTKWKSRLEQGNGTEYLDDRQWTSTVLVCHVETLTFRRSKGVNIFCHTMHSSLLPYNISVHVNRWQWWLHL